MSVDNKLLNLKNKYENKVILKIKKLNKSFELLTHLNDKLYYNNQSGGVVTMATVPVPNSMTGNPYPYFSSRNHLQKLQTQLITIDGLHQSSENMLDLANQGVVSLHEELSNLENNMNTLSIQAGQIIESMNLTKLRNLLQNINHNSHAIIFNILNTEDHVFYNNIYKALVELYTIQANNVDNLTSGVFKDRIRNNFAALILSIENHATVPPPPPPPPPGALPVPIALTQNYTYINPEQLINLIKMQLSYVNNALFNAISPTNPRITLNTDAAAQYAPLVDPTSMLQPVTPLNVKFNNMDTDFAFTH
jgi:hypothetical protein